VRISLFMPTLNGATHLPQVLAALGEQDLGEVERVAVDSGSTDATPHLLEEHGFRIHRIERSRFDHGATRDLGISLTAGEIVVLLVQDALPARPDFLRRLTEPFAGNPKLAGVYGRQRPRPGANPVLARRLENWNAGRGEPRLQALESPREFDALTPLERLERCAFDNVASAVRRTAWEQFPFGRRPFGEDVAWGKAVILGGWQLLFQPAAEVIHSHDRSPRAEFKRLYCDHHNLKELFDLTLIPTLGQARRARINQGAVYRRILAELDLPPAQRRKWEHWAHRYAFWEALGVWLGARSREWRERRRPWFALLDRLIRRGI